MATRWARMQLLARPRRPEALPKRLDRHRIYVLPTRFGLFVAILLAAMLLGALNYNNNPALLLALLLAAAAIASAIAAHLQLSGVQIDAISAEPVPAGQPLRLRVDLSAGSRAARPSSPAGRQPAWTSLPAHGRGEVELEVPSERRGWLELPRIRLSTTQPLGLVRAWSWVWPEQPLLVYPLAEALAPALPESGSDPLHTRAHASGEELHQLRPYRAGDAPRSISGSTRHAATACWCASTKTGRHRSSPRLARIGAAGPRSTHRSIGALGGCSRARGPPLHPVAACTPAVRARTGRQPPPPVPARAGADAA